MPPAKSAGEYIHLVVRVEADTDGWSLAVDGTVGRQRIALAPATLILRLWHAREQQILRGQLRLLGSEQVVAVQSHETMIELLRVWLTPRPILYPKERSMTAQAQASSVDDVLDRLRNELADLSRRIDTGKTALQGDQQQQQQLKAGMAVLERAVGDLDKARAEASKADQDALAARRLADRLLGELETDAGKRISDRLDEIDRAITAKRDAVDKARAAQTAAQSEALAAQQAFDAQSTRFKQAADAVQRLPAAIRDSIARLRKQLGELRAAVEAGQHRKAYVLARELDRERATLDRWIKPEHEQSLVNAYTTAEQELNSKRDELKTKRAAVSTSEAALRDTEEQLKALEAGRPNELKKLYATPSVDQAAAQPAAPAGGQA